MLLIGLDISSSSFTSSLSAGKEVEFEGLAVSVMFPDTDLAVEGKEVEFSRNHETQLKKVKLMKIVHNSISAAAEIRGMSIMSTVRNFCRLN